MYSSIKIQNIQDILKRVAKGGEVSLKERLYIQKAADEDQTVMAWLKKARRLQQGDHANNRIDKLIYSLDLGSSDPNPIYKPDPDDLGEWFSGVPSWVARS